MSVQGTERSRTQAEMTSPEAPVSAAPPVTVVRFPARAESGVTPFTAAGIERPTLDPKAPEPAVGGVLEAVARGEKALTRGASGPEVFELQALLERAGFGLSRYGADGSFGQETFRALLNFQAAAHLPATGVLDAASLSALAGAGTARAPEYHRLFADGVLQATLAVGYDEAGWHRIELEKILDGLAARGFEPLDLTALDDASRRRLGVDVGAPGTYFSRDFTWGGKQVTAVLQLVKPDQPDARARFVQGISGHELVLYGGHGRYGSGPDFDDLHSPKGNFVIGQPFEPGHVTLGENDLERTAFDERYQLLFFDGCNTFRYFDDLRARANGKSTDSLDVIGSTTELYWDDTADNLFAVLDGVMGGQNLDALTTRLDAINPVPGRAFVGNGFEDNDQ